MQKLTRRECLAAMAAVAVAPRRAAALTPRPMRGAFMILATPFTGAGEVDWDDLVREARFVDRCGAHGMVWPQGSSSVANLTKDERMRGLEVLGRYLTAGGETPRFVPISKGAPESAQTTDQKSALGNLIPINPSGGVRHHEHEARLQTH